MKKILYISIISLAALLTACDEWLSILPKNEQVTPDYWKSKEDVEAVLAAGYLYMTEATPVIISWSEARASSVYPWTTTDKQAQQKLQDFQLTADSKLCQWAPFYKIINMANSVIKYAPEVYSIDETYNFGAMQSHQSEAYFMRGLIYFYLVRNFGAVPLVLDPYVDDSAPFTIAKSEESVIIEQIKQDMRTALSTGSAKEQFENDRWLGASKGRATKWALYALMSDVSLWSEDYDACITYADSLINATATWRPIFMSVSDQWFTIFNPGNSNESIFELNWDYATTGKTTGSPSTVFNWNTTTSGTPAYDFTPTMTAKLLEEKALATVAGKISVRAEFGNYWSPDGITAETQSVGIWKYVGGQTKQANDLRVRLDANYIIYRMADIMLMKAEALVWKGANGWQESLDIINKIRQRAQVPDLNINVVETNELEMLTAVLDERNMELAAEGKRWYDLMRFGRSKNYKYQQDFINTIVEYNTSANDTWIRSVLANHDAWYLPISEAEIEVNDLLVQNPYYGK
ncbi:MAG: RagB/SusD family nutrient uptake outer membrane protein [Paludibacter sp.]|jgi:hypothetical protein|nr:RagB/SusD family nutrient uptake outer membrane protein [Paludibacter sp.]